MNTYHFTVAVRDARADMDDLEDRLFAAGCDDALVCSHNQAVYLEFDRQAKTAKQAIKTALANIRAAGFTQLVVQESGVSSLAEIAARAGMSRAAFSLYAKNKRGDGNFPPPVYGVSSGSALYSWPEVAAWLYKQGKLPQSQYEVALASVS
jgi:AcrR family transcriptional regulator